MSYTQELIDGVKEVYSDSKEMNELAESGNAFLGRYLDDSQSNSINIKTILEAKTLEELQDKARAYQKGVDLYRMWGKQDPRTKVG